MGGETRRRAMTISRADDVRIRGSEPGTRARCAPLRVNQNNVGRDFIIKDFEEIDVVTSDVPKARLRGS